MSTPMKKALPPPSSVRIWSTVYVGETVTWGDVGLTGSSVNPNPTGLLHEGLPITHGLFCVCWNTPLSTERATGTAQAHTGRPSKAGTTSPISTNVWFMAPPYAHSVPLVAGPAKDPENL